MCKGLEGKIPQKGRREVVLMRGKSKRSPEGGEAGKNCPLLSVAALRRLFLPQSSLSSLRKVLIISENLACPAFYSGVCSTVNFFANTDARY